MWLAFPPHIPLPPVPCQVTAGGSSALLECGEAVLAVRRVPDKMFGLLDMHDGLEMALAPLRAALAPAASAAASVGAAAAAEAGGGGARLVEPKSAGPAGAVVAPLPLVGQLTQVPLLLLLLLLCRFVAHVGRATVARLPS